MSVGQRSRRIDLIRGVSILLVLFHHFNIAYRLDETLLARAFGWEAVRAVARNGNYGVTMFFVVSGFLITTNAKHRWAGLSNIQPSAFYGFRVARIIPCLLLLLAIVNVLALAGVAIFQNHPHEDGQLSFWLVNFAALTFWTNVLIAHVGWANYPLGVLWSLSVEEVFYLSFPVLCLALRSDARLIVFWAVVIVVGPVYRLFHQGDEAGFLFAYLASFDGIAIGCCTALLAHRLSLRGRKSRLLQVAVVVAMAVLYLCQPIAETNTLGVTAMALGTAVLLATDHQRLAEPFPKSTWLAAPLCWFGRLSYELYLFHLVVLGAMRTLAPPRTTHSDSRLLLLAAYFVASAALSLAVARFYSEPLNQSIRRHLAGRPSKAVA